LVVVAVVRFFGFLSLEEWRSDRSLRSSSWFVLVPSPWKEYAVMGRCWCFSFLFLDQRLIFLLFSPLAGLYGDDRRVDGLLVTTFGVRKKCSGRERPSYCFFFSSGALPSFQSFVVLFRRAV